MGVCHCYESPALIKCVGVNFEIKQVWHRFGDSNSSADCRSNPHLLEKRFASDHPIALPASNHQNGPDSCAFPNSPLGASGDGDGQVEETRHTGFGGPLAPPIAQELKLLSCGLPRREAPHTTLADGIQRAARCLQGQRWRDIRGVQSPAQGARQINFQRLRWLQGERSRRD